MNNIYYVYQYVHPLTALPFYIGKGQGDRAQFHLKRVTSAYYKNKLFKNVFLKIKREVGEPIIQIIAIDLSESAAHALEIELIAKYGRRLYDPNGILCNHTLGGEGISGYKHTAESKEKMSKNKVMTEGLRQKYASANIGKTHTAETISKMKNIKRSDSFRAAVSNTLLGQTKTAEHRTAIAAGQLGNTHNAKLWRITFPDGHQETIKSLKTFCAERDLKVSTLRNSRNGWTVHQIPKDIMH